MPARTPEERALVAGIGAAELWAQTEDRTAATAAARLGLQAKYEREVDPDSTLDPAERALRAGHLRRAHLLRMSLAAAQSRRRAREHTAAAEVAEAALREAGEIA